MKEVVYRFADTGHWLARCDHTKGVIELNGTEFGKLSPFYRDYVWIHECIHLLYNIYDESECNKITDEVFVSRSSSAEDRQARQKFLERSNMVQPQQEQELRREPPMNKAVGNGDAIAVVVAMFIVIVLMIKN